MDAPRANVIVFECSPSNVDIVDIGAVSKDGLKCDCPDGPSPVAVDTSQYSARYTMEIFVTLADSRHDVLLR